MQLASGALALGLAAHPSPNQQAASQKTPLGDDLGQFRTEGPFGIRHLAT
jgi:hypothetical protein